MDFITITKDVCQGLDLKGSELIIASIIYGFSQDGESYYYGSTSYLMDWTRTSKQNVLASLAKLVDRGIIEKKEVWNESKFGKKCYYRFNKECLRTTKFTSEVNKVDHRGKESLPSEVNKVDHRGKESLPSEVNKVDRDNIIDNNIADNKVDDNIADNKSYTPETSGDTLFADVVIEKETFGLTPSQVGVTKKTFDNITAKIQRLQFPTNADNEFKRKFVILACSPKWQKKTIPALQMNIKKLSEYDLEFASELIDKSIAGGWQGVVFSNTPEEYKKWKDNRFKGNDGRVNYDAIKEYLNKC